MFRFINVFLGQLQENLVPSNILKRKLNNYYEKFKICTSSNINCSSMLNKQRSFELLQCVID